MLTKVTDNYQPIIQLARLQDTERISNLRKQQRSPARLSSRHLFNPFLSLSTDDNLQKKAHNLGLKLVEIYSGRSVS